MSFQRYLGVAALFAAVTAAFAQAPSPASSSQPTAPAATAAAAPGAATTTPLASAAPAPTDNLVDAHARAKPGDLKAGATKAGACAACHSVDGNSTDPQYPKLAAQQERYIARQLAMFKTGERQNPIMMPMATALTPQDMRDIGAYFAGQKVLPGVADDTVIKDGPNAGKKFYLVGQQLWRGGDMARGIPACMACHGPTGAGNPGPAYPNLGGQHAKYVADRLTAFRGGLVLGKGDYANAVMSQVAKKLTDEEIQSLATYAQGLHPTADDIAAKNAAKAATPAASAPPAASPATTPPANGGSIDPSLASPAASPGAAPSGASSPAHQH